MQSFRGLLALVLAGLPAPVAAAQDTYYVLVFSAQHPGFNRPCYSHSWASFVRVSDGREVETITISWMPRTLKVRPWALLAEPGTNLDLHDTLDWAESCGLRVSVWGPYAIPGCLYERAAAKRALLESGQVRYKSNDAGCHSAAISNCVKAVADVVDGSRVRIGQPGWGEAASFFLARSYRRYLLDSCPNDALLDLLGLANRCLVRRDLRR